MKTRKLLIVDGREDFCQNLADMVGETYTVRICRDGKEALGVLKSFRPEVLVMDIMLPGLDGVSLLQHMTRSGLHPVVLVLATYFSRYTVDALGRLGVAYLIRKPCDLRATAARILDLEPKWGMGLPAREPASEVAGMLLELGIPTKLDGFQYLCQAIPRLAEDPGQSLTKELYPAVGRLCHRQGQNVERSIRSAIGAAWENRDDRVWRRYFPTDHHGQIPRPTNAAFLSRLAGYLSASGEQAAGL